MSAAALVLAAHGSRHARHVNERIREMADRLRTTRAGREFSTIAVAYHQGEPAFAEVLDALEERDVTVVPVMTSRGYYADHVLPRALAMFPAWTRRAVRPPARVRVAEINGAPAAAGAYADALRAAGFRRDGRDLIFERQV